MIVVTNNTVPLPDGGTFDLKHLFNAYYGISLRGFWKRVPDAEAIFNSFYDVWCMHSTTINFNPSDKVYLMGWLSQQIPGWAAEQRAAQK